jgi:hypothetical protein
MLRAAHVTLSGFAVALALPWACGLETGGVGGATSGAQDATLDTSIEGAPADETGSTNDGGRDVEMLDAPQALEDVADVVTDAPDAAACIANCTGGTCIDGRCTFTCTDNAPCGNINECPNGLPCTINCIGQNACANVACEDCEVRCDGFHGCNGNVSCTDCNVRCCGAASACQGNVTCTGECGVVCGADGGACNSNVKCSGGECGDAGLKCP